MVRIIKKHPYYDEVNDKNIHLIEGMCLSTDTKPTGVATGSIMAEVDTGTVFFYDEDSSTWVEQFTFQGGSGS